MNRSSRGSVLNVVTACKAHKQKQRLTALSVFAILFVLETASAGPARAQHAVDPAGKSNQSQIDPLRVASRDAMKKYNLKSLIVRVNLDGRTLYTEALGESMTGVPATPDMHFRNGAMAFTYISTMLLELIDERQRTVSLDDKLSKYLPELPESGQITLKNLANMTSGYADYVYQQEVLKGLSLDPFRQWTSQELIQIGISKDMQFAPGSNWGYSHTNYVILGRVLEKITGLPLALGLQRYVIEPMKLTQTRSFSTPTIPEPVLHAFSSERRGDLLIPSSIPFYEESTFWNPSWTTAEGAVQTTDLSDMAKSMEIVGTGKLLSPTSWGAQVSPNLIGFGHSDPKCDACRQNTAAANYGLGVVNLGPWITQTKNFAGSGATAGYFPSGRITVGVVTTYNPEAFDSITGNYDNASTAIFKILGDIVAPNTLTAPK